jgi:hypothetical protein
LVFDGLCNFCTGAVRFVSRNDRTRAVRFATVQSPIGKRLMRECGLDPEEPTTLLLIAAAAGSGPSSGSGVGGGIGSVDEPGCDPDRRGNAEGEVLGELEGLEVVEDDALSESSAEPCQGSRHQPQGVAPDACAEAGGTDSRI